MKNQSSSRSSDKSSDLFTAPRVIASRGSAFWVIGHHVTILVAEQDYTYVKIVSPPHIPGPPPHRHVDASELFHVLEGRYDILVEGETLQLGPGDTFLV